MRKHTNKFFNNRKYYLNKERWLRTKEENGIQISLSYDIWNYYHPDDIILPGDGYVIHHKNAIKSDDRIENLQKMTDKGHRKLHASGKNNPAWLDGEGRNIKEYQKKFISGKSLWFEADKTNHYFYQDIISYNRRTDKITMTHSWGEYPIKNNL